MDKNKTVIAIGDTHGRSVWKRVVSRLGMQFDKMIFIGDYFDSREGILIKDQIKNFKDILQLQRNYPEKIELLLGNHDFHYLHTEMYSLYDQKTFNEVNEMLTRAVDEGIIKLAYYDEPFMFSHAGISQEWLDSWNIDSSSPEAVVEGVNEKLKEDLTFLSFSANIPENAFRTSSTGDNSTQSPIWIRPPSLGMSKLQGVKHVVGHTQTRQIAELHDIILIDILGTKQQFLKIQNGKWEAADV